MSSLSHPNLIKTLQTFTISHTIYIVMPLMNAGSLSSILNYKYPDGIKDICVIATILRECLAAIEYLHENKLIHRDIKTGNILLSMDGSISIGDFGVAAQVKEQKRTSFVGSFCWMAPEVISNEGYDTKVLLV